MSEVPSIDIARPRSSVGLIADRKFGSYVLARLLTAMGMWIFAPVASIEMYRITESAVWVGWLGAVQFGPQVLLSPVMGALADRGGAKAQILVGSLVAGCGAMITVPSVHGDGLLRDVGLNEAAWLLVGAGLLGIGSSIGGSAGLAMVAELVQPAELQAAAQVNSLPMLVSRAAGPALGAILIVGPGAGFGLAVAGVMNLVAFVVMSFVGLPRHLSGEPTHGERGMRATVRYVTRHPRLSLTLLGIALVGAASDPVTTLTPVLGARAGAPPEAAGWMAAAFGAGSLLALPLVSILRRRHGLFGGAGLGLLCMAIGLAVTAIPLLSAALLGMALAGVGMTVSYTSLSILVQVLSPQAMRARVLALWVVAFLGLRPVAAVLSGSGAELIGVVPVIAVLATAVLAVAMKCWAKRDVGGPDTNGDVGTRDWRREDGCES